MEITMPNINVKLIEAAVAVRDRKCSIVDAMRMYGLKDLIDAYFIEDVLNQCRQYILKARWDDDSFPAEVAELERYFLRLSPEVIVKARSGGRKEKYVTIEYGIKVAADTYKA